MRKYAKQTTEYSLSDAVAGTVLLSAVALLCFYSAVWMAQDIFPDWKLSKEAVRWICAVLIGTAVLYQIGIAALPYRLLRMFCGICIPVIFGITAYAYAKPRQIDLEDGACALATQFLVKFNRHLKTSIWIWKGKTELIGFSFAFWSFAVVICLLLAALLLQRRVLLLLLPAAVLSAELFIGYIPQWRGMALFFAALLFAQADGQGGRKMVLRVPMNQRHRYRQRWYLRLLPLGLLTFAMFGMLFCSSRLSDATNGWLMAKAPRVQKMQKEIERTAKALWRGHFSPKSETVSHQTPYYTGQNMLLVTASERPSEDLLLRGFCGTDYQNGSWICNTKPFSDACAQAGYDEAEAAKELFGKQYQMYQHADRTVLKYRFGEEFYAVYGGESTRIDYKVSHIGTHSTYAYVPYGVSFEQGSRSLDDVQFLADAKIQKERRQQEFVYNGWNYTAGMIEYSQVFDEPREGLFQWYDDFAEKHYVQTPESIPSVHQYLQSVIQDYVPSLDEYMQSYASSFVQTQGGEDTFLPVWALRMERNWDTIANLQQELSEIDHPAWRNIDRLQIAQALSEALQKYQSYSLNLEPLTEGEDPVTCFLMRTRKGYCVHFASAAVLFLRELGVPARYVTGYVVRQNEFQKSGDAYTAYVKDSGAHAWAEIYLEQVGWVPLDVTPPAARDAAAANSIRADAGTGAGTAPPGDTRLNNEETRADEEHTDNEVQDSKNAQKEQTKQNGLLSGKGADKSRLLFLWEKYGWIAMLFGAGIVSLLMLLLCKKMLHLWRTLPLREIRAGKYRKAVLRINHRMYKKLCIRRKRFRLSGSDMQYEQLLKADFQQIFTEDWTRFMLAVRQAAYAQEEVEAEDARFCWRVYETVLKRKRIGK